MIPHFEQPTLSLGPLTIHAFGALVAAAVLLGTEVLRRRARRVGLDPALAGRMVGWALVGGFIGAHLVDRLIYKPLETLADPLSVLKIWAGLSSFGGFLGAIVGLWLFVRRGHLESATPDEPARARQVRLWSYLDAIIYAFPFGWILGRTGCFVAFDHPGRATDFFLGMADGPSPHGIVRHNLGLYEALYSVVIMGLFLVLGRRARFPGFFVGLMAMLYAPVRFMFDFLREVDVRYWGLTPGQFGSLGLIVVGIVILRRGRRLASHSAPGAGAAQAEAVAVPIAAP